MIVGALASGYGGRLRKAWQRQTRGARPQSIQAFDCFMRGIDACDRFTKEDNRRGQEFLEEAIRLDPNYAKAYAKLAWTHILDAIEGWRDDYEGSMAKAQAYATQGIECDDSESWGHWALAVCYFYQQRHALALSELQEALDLNPNDADVLSDLGLYLSYSGRAEEGLEVAQKAMRLNPHHPRWYKQQLGQTYFDARRYEDAVTTFENPRSLETTLSRLYLAASHAALNDSSKASEAVRGVLELDPDATLGKWTNVKLAPYSDVKDLEHFRGHLHNAGLSG